MYNPGRQSHCYQPKHGQGGRCLAGVEQCTRAHARAPCTIVWTEQKRWFWKHECRIRKHDLITAHLAGMHKFNVSCFIVYNIYSDTLDIRLLTPLSMKTSPASNSFSTCSCAKGSDPQMGLVVHVSHIGMKATPTKRINFLSQCFWLLWFCRCVRFLSRACLRCVPLLSMWQNVVEFFNWSTSILFEKVSYSTNNLFCRCHGGALTQPAGKKLASSCAVFADF